MAVTALELCICVQKLQLGPNTGDFRGLRAASVCPPVGLTIKNGSFGAPLTWACVSPAVVAVSRQSKAASVFPVLPNDLLITNMQVCRYFQRFQQRWG